MQNKNNAVIEIDVLKLLKLLWSKIISIIVIAAVLGVAGYVYAEYIATPQYQASAWIYVNNSTSNESTSTYRISTSEISGARSLVDTYAVIVGSRTVLEEVIQEAHLKYTYKQLNNMISCSAIDNTEIFKVVVTAPDASEAALIANTIADILPEAIADIVENSSVRVVDYAVKPTVRSAPSSAKYAIIGAFLGAFLSAAIVFFRDFFDDIIHSEEDFTSTFEVPILARIPSLTDRNEEQQIYGKGKGA